MATATAINGRRVVHSVTLVVPAGETAQVEFDVDKWHVNFNIEFEEDPLAGGGLGEPGKATATASMNGGQTTLKFTNWGSAQALGTATRLPWKIGLANDGSVLGLFGIVALIGATYRADLQFMTWQEAQP